MTDWPRIERVLDDRTAAHRCAFCGASIPTTDAERWGLAIHRLDGATSVVWSHPACFIDQLHPSTRAPYLPGGPAAFAASRASGQTQEIYSMLRCTPFLLFDGNCAEAMSFYHQCLGGDLTLTRLGDTPMKEQFPAEKHGRIINAHLESGLVEISATDWMASPAFAPKLGNMSALFITCTDGAELKAVFDKLAVGAERERFQELRPMPFGTYGQFYDRYGMQWIFRGTAAP